MELFKGSKLIVSLSDDNMLSVIEKSGSCCNKQESEITYNLSDIIEMLPDKDGSCVAFTTATAQDYLKMNKYAVDQLLEKWQAVPKSFTKELLFKKKNLECYITSNGYLLFQSKTKDHWYSFSPVLSLLAIAMADVVLKDTHHKLLKGDTIFMSTEQHAIEISDLNAEAIERINKEIADGCAQLSAMQSYRRSFRFSLNRETEYIYTTAKGISRYYKKNRGKSEFCFTPWDSIEMCAKTKGFFRKKLMIVSEVPIFTTCKFPSGAVDKIINYVEAKVEDNAGSGTLFGRGSNKVYVTDTHVTCIGKKEFMALKKPYESGEMIDRSWCSSTVSIDGFKVKVGRYDWKGFCCGHGRFYGAVTSWPTRNLKENAEEHRF